eukprot:CAMPEP_0197646712 /NCGR_PEP_ID=MMETSP1338-20131121/23801_1 /TAXON_ID=43686 ORGANISM="Pelagodinium beii, Strain RCC1491" /NCGR_SAMPLE_ID=MMETSP1338 /ASSEMBLY_ACC=CAM_ASM_000754 /LENGTH=682 /DNA_ID=CAMNT_0043220369 /DNA_START=56 /DNA_END=2104 /DNA_ORIENTATION=-
MAMLAVHAMLALAFGLQLATASRLQAESNANPIRKVVTMMQKMSSQIEKEGEEEQELYDKFMCHCKSELADFKTGKATFEAAVPKLEASIAKSKAQIAQLTEEIKAGKAQEAEAESTIDSSTKRRAKEHDAFAEEKAEEEADIAAIEGALPALDKALGGSFLQTDLSSKVVSALAEKQVSRLQHILAKSKQVTESDRELATSFLQGSAEASGIGEVKGILKAQEEEIQEEVDGEVTEEKKSVNIFEELMKAKDTEKDAVEETTADKIDRLGALKVQLVEQKGQLSDAQNALSKDFDVLKKLSESCDAKTKEFDERKKTQAEELLAIQETIKILNDDDNLDLFKKALPSPSFLQLQRSTTETRRHALEIVKSMAEQRGSEGVANRTNVDLVLMALSQKGVDFTKVVKMVDDMIDLMREEGKADTDKKEYCEKQFFENTRKTKALRHKIQTLQDGVVASEEAMSAMAEDIAELQKGIDGLDKSVSESTETRQKEHEEYQKLVQEQSATKEVLQLAKTRMNAFYHPELTSPPPTTTGKYDLGFLQDGVEPPEFGKTKQNGGNRIILMIEGLMDETDKTVAEAEFEEKDSQKFYEEFLADAKAKREADAASIASKEKAKAEAQSDKVKKQTAEKSESAELKEVLQYKEDLKKECDYLLQNYDYRKEARAQEESSLTEAKAVLAGGR